MQSLKAVIPSGQEVSTGVSALSVSSPVSMLWVSFPHQALWACSECPFHIKPCEHAVIVLPHHALWACCECPFSIKPCEHAVSVLSTSSPVSMQWVSFPHQALWACCVLSTSSPVSMLCPFHIKPCEHALSVLSTSSPVSMRSVLFTSSPVSMQWVSFPHQSLWLWACCEWCACLSAVPSDTLCQVPVPQCGLPQYFEEEARGFSECHQSKKCR